MGGKLKLIYGHVRVLNDFLKLCFCFKYCLALKFLMFNDYTNVSRVPPIFLLVWCLFILAIFSVNFRNNHIFVYFRQKLPKNINNGVQN